MLHVMHTGDGRGQLLCVRRVVAVNVVGMVSSQQDSNERVTMNGVYMIWYGYKRVQWNGDDAHLNSHTWECRSVGRLVGIVARGCKPWKVHEGWYCRC